MSEPGNDVIFTSEDYNRAKSEGWLLVSEDGYYWIQKFDEDPQRRFSSDTEAENWIISQRKPGDIYDRALILDGTPEQHKG